mgnify:CR=1 FL=1
MSVRIMLIVFLILFVVFTAMTIMTTVRQTELIWKRNLEEADIISDLILNGIRYPMLTGDQDVIQRQFDNYAQNKKGIDAISLLDHRGVVMRSTDRSLINQMSLADNLDLALKGSEIQGFVKKKRTGKQIFSRLVPIRNEQKCYACHGSERNILGVLRITLDLERAFVELRDLRIRSLLLAIVSFLAIVVLLNIFLFRTVIVPIRKLAEGMNEVAHGNLNQQILCAGSDEIGSLTRIFNKMIVDISTLIEKEKALTAAEQERKEKLASVNADLVLEIKERRKAEERLNTAYRQFSDIIEFLPDATFVIDRDRKVIAWNKAMEECTGILKRDIIGKGDYAYSVPFYGIARPMLIDLIFQSDVETETGYSFFERKGDRLYAESLSTTLKEGSTVILWAIASPLYDNNGALAGAIESVRDVTQLKQNEEKILHAAKEWRITFDSINDLISIIDRDMGIVRCNNAFAALSSQKPEDMIGRNWFDVVYGPTQKVDSEIIKAVFLSGRTQFEEIFLQEINKFYEVTASPIFDSAGTVTASVLILKDITSRKELQKKERLAQLGKLVADMAHEVNNPLMIISGRAQLSLMEDIDNPEIKSNLGIIMDECQRAKDIIQRLLKFSRRGKNEITAIDVNKSLDSIISIIEHQFSLSSVEIRKHFGEGLPPVYGDERQLQEVYMNLLSNARDAMPTGGTIDVTTTCTTNMVKITLKDSGMGMSAEVMSRIFEPFYTTKEKGTGLGLSVCYGIIKNHGGELNFVSEIGKGTAAIIQLPITRGGTENG